MAAILASAVRNQIIKQRPTICQCWQYLANHWLNTDKALGQQAGYGATTATLLRFVQPSVTVHERGLTIIHGEIQMKKLVRCAMSALLLLLLAGIGVAYAGDLASADGGVTSDDAGNIDWPRNIDWP